ncbi:glycosyltransferase family A protein [Roseovarius nanhaiticus]|uniref:glycosyltransferase family A protein n=1 Tax=Roseovarius nanhaiticus TaxID=573024 RepID=UPI002491BDAE|nr:glycosyltransferase family A protein [Roseovarius nanhaiticus]
MIEPSAHGTVCSIVCTTYNHSAFCRAALESIFKQDYEHIEIVVIDDGSTDGNVRELENTLTHSPFPYRLISQENTGNVPLNVNRAIEAATGVYISFLSLDDLLLPDAISSKMQIILQNPRVVLVANTVNMEIDSAGEVTCEHFPSPLYRQAYTSARELLDVEYENLGTFYMQACVVNADIIRSISGMDPDISGDDIILRTKMFIHMAQNPELEFALIHKPGMKYRKHGNNLYLNVWNQVKTVVDWHERYFPDRALPELANKWIDHFVNQSINTGNTKALERASRYSPILNTQIGTLMKSWKYRRRRAKSILKRAILLRPLFRSGR